MLILGRARKRARTSLSDDIPVAVVQGYNNPVLGQNTINHMPHSGGLLPDLEDDLSKIEPAILFESVMNENAMNSSEFQDFLRTLSYSSKFVGNVFCE